MVDQAISKSDWNKIPVSRLLLLMVQTGFTRTMPYKLRKNLCHRIYTKRQGKTQFKSHTGCYMRPHSFLSSLYNEVKKTRRRKGKEKRMSTTTRLPQHTHRTVRTSLNVPTLTVKRTSDANIRIRTIILWVVVMLICMEKILWYFVTQTLTGKEKEKVRVKLIRPAYRWEWNSIAATISALTKHTATQSIVLAFTTLQSKLY